MPKTSSGLLSWDDAPRAVSESHRGVTATAPVLPVVGSRESAARSSTEGSSSLNPFVQVTRPDDVFGTGSIALWDASPTRCVARPYVLTESLIQFK